jgi:hypothetical protein
MDGSFRVEFGRPGDTDVSRMVVRNLSEFDSTWDRLGRLARARDLNYQVDLQASPLRDGDPILIQFLVGVTDRSSLLWHEDGECWAAIDLRLSLWHEDIRFARFHGIGCAPPTETRIAQHTVGEALAVYLLTRERTRSLHWGEIETD